MSGCWVCNVRKEPGDGLFDLGDGGTICVDCYKQQLRGPAESAPMAELLRKHRMLASAFGCALDKFWNGQRGKD